MVAEVGRFSSIETGIEPVFFDDDFFEQVTADLDRLDSLQDDSAEIEQEIVQMLRERFTILDKQVKINAEYKLEIFDEEYEAQNSTRYIYEGVALDFVFSDQIDNWHDHFNDQGFERVIFDTQNREPFLIVTNLDKYENNDWFGIDGVLPIPVRAIKDIQVLA